MIYSCIIYDVDDKTPKPDESSQTSIVDPATEVPPGVPPEVLPEALPEAPAVEPSQPAPEPDAAITPIVTEETPAEVEPSTPAPPAEKSAAPEPPPPEPAPAPTPEPVSVPIPAIIPEPASAEPSTVLPPEPPVVSTPTEKNEAAESSTLPETANTEQAPAPVLAPPESGNGVPASVLALSDDDLRLAAAYYLRNNQRAISQKGVLARQETMRRNLDMLNASIQSRGSSKIPYLARKSNLSPRLVSHYLQILVKQGKIKAEGHGKGRRYFV